MVLKIEFEVEVNVLVVASESRMEAVGVAASGEVLPGLETAGATSCITGGVPGGVRGGVPGGVMLKEVGVMSTGGRSLKSPAFKYESL